MINILFPGGKGQALTFSYDDGSTHDRRLIDIFNRYGLKGTFHLNSGRLDQEGYISHEEVATLYEGHEVACHGVNHLFPDRLSPTGLINEWFEDRCTLELLSGKMVTGLSYAFGIYTDAVVDTARNMGIEYARTIADTGNLFPPSDFMRWHPTAHHKKLFSDSSIMNIFLNPLPFMRPALLYVWGHSYEFEMNNDWDAMEAVCAKLSGHETVWYTTNIEYCRYAKAARSLVFDTQHKEIYNPSNIKIWYEENGTIKSI